MDATSANRIVAIGLFFSTVVVFAFAFFSMTGGFRGGIRGMGLPGTSYKFDDDAAVAPSVPPRPPAPEIKRAPTIDEPYRPQSEAEYAHYAALEKLKARDERSQGRVASRKVLLDFTESDAGKELARALELAREGKFAEAKPIFEKLTAEMTELDARLRMRILKSAVQVYQGAKDMAGLKELLRRYLGIVEEELSRADLDERKKAGANELLERVQETLTEIEAEG